MLGEICNRYLMEHFVRVRAQFYKVKEQLEEEKAKYIIIIIVYLQHFDRLTLNRNGPLNPI